MKKLINLILIFQIFSFCAPKQEKIEKIIEDGVEVIVNHLEPYQIKGEPITFSLEEELLIDTEKEDLAGLGIGGIEEGDVDAEGNIYLASREQIFKFDNEGSFVQTIGQIGQGPGEFQRIRGVRITNSGELSFYDSGNAKFLLFNSDGTLKKEIKKTSGIFSFIGIYLDNGYYLLREREENKPKKGQRRFQYALLNRDFKKIINLEPSFFIELPDMSDRFNLMSYLIWCEVINDKIFVSSNMKEELEIEVYNTQGELLKKIRKTGRIKISNDFKEEYLERWKRAPAWEIYDIKNKHYFPDYFPSFKMFWVDEEGRIFVETYEKGENEGESIIHIFNPEGIFVGCKSLKDAAARKFKNNRLYCIYRKESGFEELVAYKVKWEYK